MPGLGPRLVRWRRPVLALVALLTLGALLTLIDFSDPRDPRPRLRIDPTVDRLLDPNSAARAFQRSTGELFGAEQRAVLAVAGPDYYSDTGLALLGAESAARGLPEREGCLPARAHDLGRGLSASVSIAPRLRRVPAARGDGDVDPC